MIPKILKNFNLTVNGLAYVGRVEELVLPKLSIKMEDYHMGGLDTPLQIDMGMEKLECDMTLSEYDTEVIKLFVPHRDSATAVPLTLRGAFDNENGVTPVVIALLGAWKSLDFGSWKAGEKAPLKISVALVYYRLDIGGDTLVEIDINNMERHINGVEQVGAMHDAVGLF